MRRRGRGQVAFGCDSAKKGFGLEDYRIPTGDSDATLFIKGTWYIKYEKGSAGSKVNRDKEVYSYIRKYFCAHLMHKIN